MTNAQAIDYLETVADIEPREMSRAMFRLVRAAARRAQAAHPGMAGYYDPEFHGPRAEPWRYAFWPAPDTVPQSPRLRALLALPDPWAGTLSDILEG